jgi:hypothetical protein
LLSKNLNIKIYRTIILSVLYGCETWSLALSEERGVLRRRFGLKRNEVTGEWRKLHYEKLNDLHCPPTIVRVIESRKMRWAWHVARIDEGRGVYRGSVGKPEAKRPLGRPRYRGENNTNP